MKSERITDRAVPAGAAFYYDQSRESKTPSHVSASQPRRFRILCVDDDVVGTQVLGEVLERCGYSVVLHHDPSEALGCDLGNIDLALVDFEMPGMNGRELLLRMRSLGARFPVVLHSGYAESLSPQDRVLFARCIDKGRPTQHLLESIATFLDPDQVPDYGP